MIPQWPQLLEVAGTFMQEDITWKSLPVCPNRPPLYFCLCQCLCLCSLASKVELLWHNHCPNSQNSASNPEEFHNTSSQEVLPRYSKTKYPLWTPKPLIFQKFFPGTNSSLDIFKSTSVLFTTHSNVTMHGYIKSLQLKNPHRTKALTTVYDLLLLQLGI